MIVRRLLMLAFWCAAAGCDSRRPVPPPAPPPVICSLSLIDDYWVHAGCGGIVLLIHPCPDVARNGPCPVCRGGGRWKHPVECGKCNRSYGEFAIGAVACSGSRSDPLAPESASEFCRITVPPKTRNSRNAARHMDCGGEVRLLKPCGGCGKRSSPGAPRFCDQCPYNGEVRCEKCERNYPMASRR